MRKVSVDPERKTSKNTAAYKKFQQLLAGVSDVTLVEQFPRAPQKKVPIPSYGIIAVHGTENELSYYITQRRTTIEFGEVIRCGPRKEYLYEYLSHMTPHERRLLIEISRDVDKFDKVWNDYMLNEANLFNKTQAKTKLRFLAFGATLESLIKLTHTTVANAPWEFPKGRESPSDSTRLQTAVREMEEEGRLQFDKIVLMHPEPITIVTRGTDDCLYSTTYYVLKCKNMVNPRLMMFEDNLVNDYSLSLEMKDRQWITFGKDQEIRKGSTPLSSKIETTLRNLHNQLRAKC